MPENRLQHRPGEPREPALRVEHAVHVPAEHVGQRQQPDRLRGRRAVDDDEVVVARRRELLDVGEREHLVEARARPRAPRPRARRRRPSRARRPGSGARRPRSPRTGPARSSCWPQSRCAIGVGRSPSGDVERVGERVRGIGRARRSCADRARRRATAVAAATVVLPTPPLPVNSRMRMRRARLLASPVASPGDSVTRQATASTCFFSSFSALPMIRPAARRFTSPGSGTASSTARS